ncbi:MAG TPA: 4Fe-4S binding protein [Thermoplasmata archaeon]|nr:4Fe-4S binding protein [Thermoplasmata archaeon]
MTASSAVAKLPPAPLASEASDLIHTSSWRTIRPVVILEKCTRCNVCWKFCPDDAIGFDTNGFPTIRYEFCKGCGICALECRPGAIRMEAEV